MDFERFLRSALERFKDAENTIESVEILFDQYKNSVYAYRNLTRRDVVENISLAFQITAAAAGMGASLTQRGQEFSTILAYAVQEGELTAGQARELKADIVTDYVGDLIKRANEIVDYMIADVPHQIPLEIVDIDIDVGRENPL